MIEFGSVVVAVSNHNFKAFLEGVERIGGIIHLNLQVDKNDVRDLISMEKRINSP